MKKFLRFLALIVASVIPGIGMAATNYGIYFSGTMITSDNCQNLTSQYLKSGSVKYDYSSNTLTLKNVRFDVDNESYFISVTSSAKNGLKVVVEGYNYIGRTNGVAFAIHKPTGASASSPSVYFQGNGVLYFNNCGIETFDGTSISFGKSSVSDTDGGLDIYAKSITSRNSAGGYVWISDANLHLSGNTSGNGTFGGFTSVYMYNGIAAYSEDGKTKYSYGGASVLRDENNNMVTGPAYIGYEKYGLNLCGTEVTAGNYNRLKIASPACLGTFSYNPSTKTLYMKNAELLDNSGTNKGYWKHHCLVNSIDGLKVDITGSCKISDNIGGYGVYSTGDITFSGSTSIPLEIRSSGYKAIYMASTGKTLSFEGLEANVSYGGIDLNKGTLFLVHSWLDVDARSPYGGIKNMDKLVCRYTSIATDGVYYDDQANKFYKKGSTAEYTGELNFRSIDNYYGIQVCGVEVTEHNYSNVAAPYLESGTISYDPRANELTLDNITIDTKERGAFPALIIHSYAKTGMKILLKGRNVIKKTNGAAVCFQKPSNATSVSNAHYFIDGTGSLTLEDCGILCYDFCNLCFGSGVSGGQGLGGCTVNAKYIESRTKGDGRIWFTDCMMTLTGSDYGTFINFDNVFTSSHCIIRTPENGKYDSTNQYLADANGNKVTGEVYIGWEKYGLRICGIEVNEIIKDNIKDLINPSPTICKRGTTSEPAYQTFSYDPETKTLYMKDVAIWDYYNKTNPMAPCIENTGDELHIKCEGTCEINNQRPTDAIYSTKNLEFRGSGTLNITCNQDNGIVMGGENVALKFYYCNVNIQKNPSTGGTLEAITYDTNKYRLYVEHANVKIVGAVKGIDCYALNYAAISTPQIFIQPANNTYPTGCLRKFGYGEYFGETVFTPTTTNYGILVSGHELNDVNADNFYFDDITTGTVSYDQRSNTLTLDNITANCTQRSYINGEVRDYHPNGLVVSSRATNDLKINLAGRNVFYNVDGVGANINRNITFGGNGTLDFGDRVIVSYDGSNITFKEYCTVQAKQLYGSNNNGGKVNVLDRSSLYLTGAGNSYPTVYGLTSFNTHAVGTNKVFTAIITPNGASYDRDQKKLLTHVIDGEKVVYGPVEVAPVMYCGVEVEGIQVHSANCHDIFRDVPHEGTMRYDSLYHKLYMADFKVAGSRSVYGVRENYQGRNFHINLSGENEVTNFTYFRFGDDAIIESDDNGSLYAPRTLILPDKSIAFNNCTIDGPSYIESKSEEGGEVCVVAQSNIHLMGNDKGNPTINGFSGGDNTFLLFNSKITTPENYTDDYSGEVIIQALVDYDIYVGGRMVTNQNKDDILGDGTMRLEINEDTGEYLIYMNNAHLDKQIFISDQCVAEDVVFILEGYSSIQVGRGDCIYAGRPIVFASSDGIGRLTLDTPNGSGIYVGSEFVMVADCEVYIYAGMYGIEGTMSASPVAGEINDYVSYVDVWSGNYKAKLLVDTKEYNGEENFKDICLYLEENNEVLQPEDCAYNTETYQLCDATGAPIHNTVAEIIMKPARITVEDITRLIDMYLEPDSDITILDITRLIDRYLEQE